MPRLIAPERKRELLAQMLATSPFDLMRDRNKPLDAPFDPLHMGNVAKTGDVLGQMLDFAPGIGDAKSGISALDSMARGDMLAASAGLFGVLPGVVGNMKLYHGSPHAFDAFDMSKIGTGAGAQTEGRGFYLTNKRASAKNFLQGKSGFLYTVDVPDSARFANLDEPLTAQDQSVIDAFRSLEQKAEPDSEAFWRNVYRNKKTDLTLSMLDRQNSYSGYKKAVLDEIDKNARLKSILTGEIDLDRSPLLAYRTLRSAYGSDNAVSDLLNRNGVNGFSMSGANDRFSDPSSTNYVVFDTNLLPIIKREQVTRK